MAGEEGERWARGTGNGRTRRWSSFESKSHMALAAMEECGIWQRERRALGSDWVCHVHIIATLPRLRFGKVPDILPLIVRSPHYSLL